MVNVKIREDLVKLGYSLLPLNNNSKIAKCKWGKKSKEELNQKTLEDNSNNFAVRTGKISGIYVLDIDNYKKDCEIQQDLFKIDTLQVKTPRGGFHLYFKYNKKIKTTTNEGLAIDIRSDGGYVVAPTSTIDGKSYEIIKNAEVCETPDWLMDYILKKICKNSSSNTDTNNREKNFKPVSFEELEEKVMTLDEERASNYDDWLKIGFIIQHTSFENNYFEKGRQLFHNFSKRCPEKYDEEKCNTFFDNFRETENKIKYASLLLMNSQDNNLKNDEIEYHGDKDLALKLFEDHKNNIVNTSNGIYCKHPITNTWSKDHEKMFRSYIQNCNYFFIDKDKNPKFIKNQTTKWKAIITQLETYIFTNVEKDEIFLEKLDNYTGYIPFLNCCYDLVNRKWIEKLPDHIYCSQFINVRIDLSKKTPNESEIQEVENWLTSILENFKSEFLCYCIRMLGGHYLDKKWLASIGLRNSGKGVIERIFLHLFANFVGQIDTKNLELKNTTESTERSRGCLEPFATTRLVFSSEAKPNAIMDGTLLKSTGSGGDKFYYRQSYGTLQSGYFRAGFIFQANTLPKIEPADAYENMLYFPMPCKFVSEEELNTNFGGYKVKLADPKIKDKILDEKYRMAFYHVIFSYYKNDADYKLLIESCNELRSDEEEDVNEFAGFEKMINENFVITDNKDDTIKAKDLHFSIKNNGFILNADRVSQYLKTMGVILDKKGVRQYKKIKVKDDDE